MLTMAIDGERWFNVFFLFLYCLLTGPLLNYMNNFNARNETVTVANFFSSVSHLNQHLFVYFNLIHRNKKKVKTITAN